MDFDVQSLRFIRQWISIFGRGDLAGGVLGQDIWSIRSHNHFYLPKSIETIELIVTHSVRCISRSADVPSLKRLPPIASICP